MKGGDFAKIELESLRVVNSTFKPQEIKRALQITDQHQKEFLRKRDEYFNCR